MKQIAHNYTIAWPRLLGAASAACILTFFFMGAGGGLHAYFTTDDLANLNHYRDESVGSILASNVLFFSPSYRPLGGLFYRALYAAFGFHPLPYRIVCFLFLVVNLGLAFRIAQLLTGSLETASVSTLIGAFHPRLVDLYWSTGTIYDILCFTFFFAAFDLYIEIRSRGKDVSFSAGLWILLLFVFALNSKEMAVALPPLILVYEFLFHGAPLRQMIVQARWALVAAALTVPYIWGKRLPGSVLVQFDRYQPDVSLVQFLRTYASYLRDLLYIGRRLQPPAAGILLLVLLLTAVLLRSRALVFSWCLAIITSLPIAFIPPRAAFAFYIPLTGWTLYAGILLVYLRTRIFGHPKSAAYGLITLLVVFCLLLRAYRIQRDRMGGPELLGQAAIRHVAEDLDQYRLVFPKAARVLAVNDPFAPERYELLLLLRLYANDPTLKVDHASVDDCAHEVMLQWSGKRLARIREGRCSAFVHW